jgi:hypothetical protein
VVSVLATGHKGLRVQNLAKAMDFKSDKNPQHTFLSDGK